MAILRAFALVAALTVATGTLVSPAFAAPTPWVHPGTHPFEGSSQEAAALHEVAIGLPAAEFMKGVALYSAGQCEEHYLQDGEVLQNTFTKSGKARSVQTIVAFKDPKSGQSLSTQDLKRRSMRCRIPGRTDGATVVFPFVCGNWAVQYLPPVPPAEVLKTPVPPSPPTREIRTTIVTPQPLQIHGGVTFTVGQGDCLKVVGTPIYTTGGSVSETNRFEDR